MASERGRVAGFAVRVTALVATAGLFGWTCVTPGLAAARIVAALLVVAATTALWHHVGRTGREVARFVEALGHGDFAQRFGGAPGADPVSAALDDAMRRLRAERAAANEEQQIAAALAEAAPAALLLIDGDGRVSLANKAARRLFGAVAGTRVEDFAAFAPMLAVRLSGGDASHGMVTLPIDGIGRRAIVSRSDLVVAGRALRMVAVQPVHRELSAVELAAQADLVRVLTHEIMNSLTPIVSLAGTAAALVARIGPEADGDLADARAAIETLARRANGTLHFVEAYRSYSREPAIERRRFAARAWANEIARLHAASTPGARVPLTLAIAPENMRIDADPDLLAQVALNLLKNGAEAAAAHRAEPAVSLTIELLPGARTRLRFRDNGPGVAPHLADDIFLPFFTTKPGGTGVGLSLARRIVVAHGGTLSLGDTPAGGGTCFEATL